MIIRKEKPEDYDKVYSVVKSAFSNAEHADGNEQDLVNELRKSDAFIPELSLVAEMNGIIAGHIMFTKASVGESTVLVLAPLSVLPEYQRQGIGMALMQEGHRAAGKMGYTYSVVLGSERYYPKAGYLPAEKFGIRPPLEVPSENFMAYRLKTGVPDICGMLKYAEEFGIDSCAAEIPGER